MTDEEILQEWRSINSEHTHLDEVILKFAKRMQRAYKLIPAPVGFVYKDGAFTRFMVHKTSPLPDGNHSVYIRED